MRMCKLVGPRIDEAAARGLSVESRDHIDERLVGGEVVPEILQPWRRPVGIGRSAHSDHHLEVGVGLHARDLEAGNGLVSCGSPSERWGTSAGRLRSAYERVSHSTTSRLGSLPCAIDVSTVVVVQITCQALRRPARAGRLGGALELRRRDRVGDVWAALDLGAEPPGLLYAVNREYAPADREPRRRRRGGAIPPVSGGAFRFSEEPLDPSAVIAEVADERAGGIACSSVPHASSRADARCSASTTRPTRAWPSR